MLNIYAAPEESATTEVVTSTGTADTSADGQPAPGVAGSQWTSLIIMIAIFAVFYFVLILPQKKQEKKQRAMINALQPGDEIITIGGIYGKIQKVSEDYVVIESTADKTKIKLAKSSISRCLTEHDDEPEAK